MGPAHLSHPANTASSGPPGSVLSAGQSEKTRSSWSFYLAGERDIQTTDLIGAVARAMGKKGRSQESR